MDSLLASIGLGSELMRFLAFGGLASIFEWVLKPSISFLADGSPRPWRIPFSNENPEDSTLLPWWLVAIITGGAAALFL